MKTGDNVKEHPQRLELREQYHRYCSEIFCYPWYQEHYNG